jgi:hypothetical protein
VLVGLLHCLVGSLQPARIEQLNVAVSRNADLRLPVVEELDGGEGDLGLTLNAFPSG